MTALWNVLDQFASHYGLSADELDSLCAMFVTDVFRGGAGIPQERIADELQRYTETLIARASDRRAARASSSQGKVSLRLVVGGLDSIAAHFRTSDPAVTEAAEEHRTFLAQMEPDVPSLTLSELAAYAFSYERAAGPAEDKQELIHALEVALDKLERAVPDHFGPDRSEYAQAVFRAIHELWEVRDDGEFMSVWYDALVLAAAVLLAKKEG